MQRRMFLALSSALMALGLARRLEAQGGQKPFNNEQLDQMLAQIALYPDELLSQVLMAATYPLEVVEAARWSKANPKLKGDPAIAAVQDKTWDVSVKSLTAFPDVLQMMDAHLDWTQNLGDAMLAQEQDVAQSIQRLRAKAAAAGNLQSGEQQTVTTQGEPPAIQYIIAPTNPQIIYVPSYDPGWAYGPWPYPAHPIYYPFGGALARGFMWGLGFAAAGAMFGGWNWNNGYTNINVNRATNIDRSFNRNNIGGDGRWQHRPEHRRGAGYRDPATRERFNPSRPGAGDRETYRGRTPSQQPANRPGQGPGQGPGANRPGQGPGQGPGANRPQTRPTTPRQPDRRPNGIGDTNRGPGSNRESQRGRQQQQRAQQPRQQRSGGGQRQGGGGANRGGGAPRGGGGRR